MPEVRIARAQAIRRIGKAPFNTKAQLRHISLSQLGNRTGITDKLHQAVPERPVNHGK